MSFRDWVTAHVGQTARVDHEHWFSGSQVGEGELQALHTGTLPNALDTSDRYKTHVYVIVGDLAARVERVHSIETSGDRIECCLERSSFRLSYDDPGDPVDHHEKPCPIHDEPIWR
jgi:hypothetical protein